jgi:hypothetical protein
MNDKVWYASYGSNLLRSRFMCYIQGGSPEGAAKQYDGCTDKSAPENDRPITIPHELYFSQSSGIWEGKGVAFIKSERNDDVETLGRMYLITREQFVQVVRQENGVGPDDLSLNIDFDETLSNGEAIISGEMWYGRIIYIGDKEGYPILTFTSPGIDKNIVPNAPGEKYLTTIIRGILEIYTKSNDEINNYFLRTKGIKDSIPASIIQRIIGEL